MDFFVFGYIVFVLLLCFVGVPLVSFCLLTLRRDWKKLYVIKRHRLLLLAVLIPTLCIEFIYLPANAIEALITGTAHYADIYGVAFVVVPCVYFATVAIIIRIWLLYYQKNLCTFYSQRSWLSALDPHTDEQDFFKRHEKTLGSPRFLLKYSALAVLFLVVTSIILKVVDFDLTERLMSWSVVCGAIVIAAVVWVKTRRDYYDQLGIKSEMSVFIKVVLYGVIVGLGLVLCYYTIDSFDYDMYNFGWFYMCLYLTNGVVVVLTLVPKRLSLQSEDKTRRKTFVWCEKCCFKLCCFRSSVLEARSSVRNLAISNAFGAVWTDIVCTEFGFARMMEHLELELSLETLLFITEYMQLKQNVLMSEFEQVMKKVMEKNVHTRFELELPEPQHRRQNSLAHVNIPQVQDRIPQSQIVASTKTRVHTLRKDDAEVTQIGKQLIDGFARIYKKYISASADLMINIKSRTRKNLEAMFELDKEKKVRIEASLEKYANESKNLTKDEILEWLLEKLIPPMELAVTEIVVLMGDSYRRFRRNTKAYEKAVELALAKHNKITAAPSVSASL